MSLVRLLKAGKSLTDLRNSTSRYRVRSRFLLPKFGSTKNPFTAPVPVELIQAASESSPGVARYQKTPAELSAARLKKTVKLPETTPASPEETRVETETPAATGPFPSLWQVWLAGISRSWRKLNPFSKVAPVVAAVKPVTASRAGRSPVQAELSLDNIKVMRNDLNEADVEIMPAKPPAPDKPEPVVRRQNSGATQMTAALVESQPG